MTSSITLFFLASQMFSLLQLLLFLIVIFGVVFQTAQKTIGEK